MRNDNRFKIVNFFVVFGPWKSESTHLVGFDSLNRLKMKDLILLKVGKVALQRKYL